MNFYNNLNKFRALMAAFAETIDIYRIAPRLIVVGYGFLVYDIINWFMSLGIEATTQQTSFVTAIVSLAAAIFAFYANTGINWKDYNFKSWDTDNKNNNSVPEFFRKDDDDENTD